MTVFYEIPNQVNDSIGSLSRHEAYAQSDGVSDGVSDSMDARLQLSQTPRWSGRPPFYRITGVKDGELVREEVASGSQEFSKLFKWVGTWSPSYGVGSPTRLILNHPKCHVDKKTIEAFFENGSQ